MDLLESYCELVKIISEMNEVLSIGKSGGEKLPEKNESDIDIFVFCREVPSAIRRQEMFLKLDAEHSNFKISKGVEKFWGVCDYVIIEGAEICLMYYNISDMNNDIESVLKGSRLDREDEYYYPTGRCAAFLSMHILYDKESYILNMKKYLSLYPDALAERLSNHHIEKINDEEDFHRAVSRGDVLFYHSTLESAIDHFLQALFALNHCFFPSRKRTIKYIEGFKYKPQNCSERLLRVIELGAKSEGLSTSYDEWSGLCKEIVHIANNPIIFKITEEL